MGGLVAMQQLWQTARLGLLAFVFLSVTLTFGRTFILTKPATARTDKTGMDLPESASLSGWQATDSTTLPNAGRDKPDSTPNRQYRYLKDGTPLTITVRYFAESNGDMKPIMQTYTPLLKADSQFKLEVREQDKLGAYGVFVEKQQAHLMTCMNGRGESTFTHLQFQHNRNVKDLLSERPFLWLMGLGEIRDRRCLAVHLQIPLKNKTPEQAYQLLEQTWSVWDQQWRPRLQNS